MGKLIIDGNKVYTVDEACLKRKNMKLQEVCKKETKAVMHKQQENRQNGIR